MIKKLKDICEIIGGIPAPQEDSLFDSNGFPFVRMKDLGKYHLTNNLVEVSDRLSYSFHKKHINKIVKKGAILLPRSGSVALNHRAILGMDAFVVSHICALEIKDSNVTNSYLYYALRNIKMNKITKKTTGLDAVTFEDLGNLKIPIPSLPEQKLIAEILDKADSVRQKRKESIALLDELLRSVFLDMFGDPVRNEKGWEKKQFKSIVEDYDYGLSNKADEDNTGIPMLRMNNITYEGRIDISKLKYINKSKFDFQKYKLIKNDFLFNRTNSPELVGKCSVWNSEQEITFAGYLIRFRFVKDIANPYFVSHYFNSSFGKKFLYTRARPSINMSNISASTLMGFPILIPPIKLQTQFAKIVEQVQVTKARMEESLSEMDNQFEGLMQGVFR